MAIRSLKFFGLFGILLQILVVLIVLLIQLLVIDNNSTSDIIMAAKKLDPKILSVGILGYTGASGKALAEEILKNNLFKSTVLIGRRAVEYTDEIYKNATQKLVDFEKLTEYDDVFKGLDVVYCCLGTTRGKSGAEGFKKVDYDYIVESAKMAKKNGCKHFHLISSGSADKNSMFLYLKVKGQSEEAISNMGFERASIYRPGILLAKRDEVRGPEAFVKALTKPFQYFAPKLITTPVEILAKAQLGATLYTDLDPKSKTPNVEILDNYKIFDLAKIYDDNIPK